MYVERKKESVMKINKNVIFALLCVVFVSIVMSGQHSSTHKSNPTRGKNKVVTSTNESPMKVKTKPEIPSGPTKEEREAAEKARAAKEKQEKIKNQMMGAFNNSKNTDTNGEGKAWQSYENGGTGASSTKSGTIVVKVKVNPQGEVISAEVVDGRGAAYNDATARKECVKASMKCKFSVATDETKVQTGTITWTIK